MILISFILTFIGCAAICVSISRHHKQFWNISPDKNRSALFKYFGWAVLIIAAAFCMKALGGSLGFVTWLGFVTGCALVIIFLLPYLPSAQKNPVRKARRT